VSAEPRFGRTTLPEPQRETLRQAKRLEIVSLAYLLTAVVLVYISSWARARR
jgi:hypothetical protein